jgi:hypothetical protein
MRGDKYGYKWSPVGPTLTLVNLETGEERFLQNEDASELYDSLMSIRAERTGLSEEEVIDAIIDEYF